MRPGLRVAIASLLCATAAQAQEGAWQAEQFEAATSAGAWNLAGARLLPHLRFDLSFSLAYANRPLELQPVFTGDTREGGVVVPSRLRGEIVAGIGLFDFAQFVVAMPGVATVGTSTLGIAGRQPADLQGFFAGDLRLMGDIELIGLGRFAGGRRPLRWGPGIALGVTGWMPTGAVKPLEGEGSPRVEPRVAIDFTAPFGLRVGGHFGYVARKKSQVFTYVNDDVVRWGGSVTMPFARTGLEAVLSGFGTVVLAEQPDPVDPELLVTTRAYDSAELLGGLRWKTRAGLHVGVAGGGPLLQGVGTPRWRLLAQVGWTFDFRPLHLRPEGDTDFDGIINQDDLCPFEAETYDRVRDADGCPEADAIRFPASDQVEIRKQAAAARKAAAEAAAKAEEEEVDPFGGGALPARAPIATLPELQPRVDTDGDGLWDDEDLCPNEVEDQDGFADGDGCPDPDDDLDGIPDSVDACRTDAETPNRFEDEDGCPDLGPDADNDRIGDFMDLCPYEAETVNGTADLDGCPEADDATRARYAAGPAPVEAPAVEPTLVEEEPPPPALPPPPIYTDLDADGVADFEDACPDAAEDTDGFEDFDGCPDPDDDGDGIPDALDQCRQEAETANGVLDADGCPDIAGDLDGDGIGDVADRCPLEPEVWNGVRDGDGCPEDPESLRLAEQARLQAEAEAKARDEALALARPKAPPVGSEKPAALERPLDLPELTVRKDGDGDGILDDEDVCPDEPEDVDGLADQDGCPELDVDGDGVADTADACPLESESPNRFEDADGCPDVGPDGDGDGVEDAFDVCPFEAENRDNVRDEDGCPEADPALVAELTARYLRAGAPRPAVVEAEERPAFLDLLPPLAVRVDTDGDGIPDDADGCADRSEDFDGYQDEDGCPEEDNDGDGLIDPRDRCPDAAEIVNGVNDDDGCPDRGLDKDDDGVDDAADLCPYEPEDLDGVRDWDGCPEVGWGSRPATVSELAVAEAPPTDVSPGRLVTDVQDLAAPADGSPWLALLPPLQQGHDADGDGLSIDDDCPWEPEDMDGFMDQDGCPETDDDGDGIDDLFDACPRDAENINAYQDLDGCPDAVPREEVDISGVVRGIEFGSGSTVIASRSFGILDKVARAMQADPRLTVLIEGHTDSVGNRERNVELSRARAQAVATWLTAQGIAASRFTVRGYGPDRPVDTNDTNAGRSANRRVELTYSRSN